MAIDIAKLQSLEAAHPKPAQARFVYGTAGFRERADTLDSVFFRVGLLAVLRAKHQDKVIGVMITASHNPVEDNGVKLVDPLGEMLAASWEEYATLLANSDIAQLPGALQQIIDKEKIDLSKPAKIVVARDTRPSGDALLKALVDGVHALAGSVDDRHILTTPQLHYLVRTLNTNGAYGAPTEEGYYAKLSAAFKRLLSGQNKSSPLTVDAANGVGAEKITKLHQHIGAELLDLVVVNDGSTGILNHNCGADFVKVQQKRPEGVVGSDGRYASLDGDADRLVYFYFKDGAFRLLDGDKISSLAAGFIRELADKAGVTLDIGVIQTAYANGSSTHYISKTLGVPVTFACTGVKHLHHKAEEHEVGVYFEANGHGTVLFSDAAVAKIQASERAKTDTAAKEAQQLLLAFIDVINQTVGDALSDLLMVEVILAHRKWSLADWDASYTDLPNRQLKCKVKDRTIFKTINADTELVEPAGLQPIISALASKYPQGRSFVRPSGTEDVVRVYAEAATRETCDALGLAVLQEVFDRAGGIGDRPSKV